MDELTELEELVAACAEVVIRMDPDTGRWTVETGTAIEVESDDLYDAIHTALEMQSEKDGI